MAEPKILTLPAGEHWICTCGKSKNSDFCDGSHEGSGKKPKQVVLNETKSVAVCMCAKSNDAPYCDGSHKA